MVELTAKINTAQLQKQLRQVQKRMPFITAKAMNDAAKAARDDARASAFQRLHKPRRQTIEAIKSKGPTVAQVRRGKAQGEVYIDSEHVGYLRPNIIRTRETSTPKRGRGILQPTRNLRLNRHGNIHGFNGGRVRQWRRDERYLDIPLGNTSKRTRHLSAGLYRREGSRLVKILSYKKSRTINPKWTQYPIVVRNSYQRNLARYWRAGYRRELSKIGKSGGRSG